MFRVAPVEQGNTTFKVEIVSNVASALSSTNAMSDLKCRYETGVINHSLVNTESRIRNGFIDAMITAYNHHLPLVLSPDDFWLLISLTVADFLGNNKKMAERYRKTFVDHEGKQELIVLTAPRPVEELMKDKQHWNAFVETICQMIAVETKTDISAIMCESFSTTGTIENAVMNITLMEMMKNYFDYTCVTRCGIPEVTLEGRAEDYESIISRLQKPRPLLGGDPVLSKWGRDDESSLGGYVDRVLSHMNKILEAKKGSVDVEFWREMVSLKKEKGSGASPLAMNGWITDFIQRRGSPQRYDLHANYDKFALTKTPFKIVDDAKDGKAYEMTLCGGFVGCSQDPSTKAVRPAIGWLLFFNEGKATSGPKPEKFSDDWWAAFLQAQQCRPDVNLEVDLAK